MAEIQGSVLTNVKMRHKDFKCSEFYHINQFWEFEQAINNRLDKVLPTIVILKGQNF